MYAYYVITIELYGDYYSYAMRISDHENIWPILDEGIRAKIVTLTHFSTKKEAVITAAAWNESWAEKDRLMPNPPINGHVIWG